MLSASAYLMENEEEAIRLEIKTDPKVFMNQANWCGVTPGMHVLDAGCGPGLTTALLHRMIQPGGRTLGLDYSQKRVEYARERYALEAGVRFEVHDLRNPTNTYGPFDLILARFVLEYNLGEGQNIVRNLTRMLKPGGALCLLDLDHNCLSHYPMAAPMEEVLLGIMRTLEDHYNFDPYVGRKLYAYLYDEGYQDIVLDLRAHHLIYGDVTDADFFNWLKKVEVASRKAGELFARYPGGYEGFFRDFQRFFKDPRRFTYTPLILCKGVKPTEES